MRGDDQGTGLNTLSSANDRFSLPILGSSFQPQDVHGQARPPTSILHTLKGILPLPPNRSLTSEGCTWCLVLSGHSLRLCGFLQLLPHFSHLTLRNSTQTQNYTLREGGDAGVGSSTMPEHLPRTFQILNHSAYCLTRAHKDSSTQ